MIAVQAARSLFLPPTLPSFGFSCTAQDHLAGSFTKGPYAGCRLRCDRRTGLVHCFLLDLPTSLLPSGPDILPSSCCTSTRLRQFPTATTGVVQPAVENGFGHGGVSRLSVRRTSISACALRRHPVIAFGRHREPSRPPTPVPTIFIPSDRQGAEHLGAPLSREPPNPAFFPPLGPTWTLSMVSPDVVLMIPSHTTRTPARTKRNMQSPRAMAPSIRFCFTGRWPYLPKIVCISPHTRVPHC